MKKALKITRKILFWIFFVSLFLTTTVTVLLYVYEDDIKQYAIDELNSHLKTEFQAQDVELSFFNSFPQASIEFTNVFVADAYPNIQSEDTLFFADRMFFNFNLKDLYDGDYHVNRVSIHEGGLYLKTTESGEVNFDIIKEQKDPKEESENFEFLLELLEVENFELKYRNLSAKQFYDLQIKAGLFQGNFSKDEFDVLSEADLQIHQLKSNSFTLVSDKEAVLNLDLAVNMIDKSYTFKKGDLQIEEMPFHVTGIIDSSSVDLNISGDNIELHDMVNSVVEGAVEEVKQYEGTGTINFNTHIHGPISSTTMPAVEAKFDIFNGTLTEPESNLTITDLSFKGLYQNEQNDRAEQLEMKNVKMKMLDSYFNGEAIISSFAQPRISTKMDGNIHLGRFHQFFGFKNIEKLNGRLIFNCLAELQFFDPEYNKKSFNIIKSDGTFELNKIVYKASNDHILYKDISGEMVLKDKDAAANNLEVHTANSDIIINGAMKNLMAYLDGSGSLGLIASIESKNLDLDEFVMQTSQEQKGPLMKFKLPENLNLNVDLDVKKLLWDGHAFSNVSSKMLMSNRTVDMKNLNLNMVGGHVRGNLKFKNLIENGNFIDGRLWFSGINIQNLFKEWDNFDQKSITHKHLTGTVKGDVDLLLSFNPYMSLIDDQLYAHCNILIQNGKLEELETMKMITDYMRTNKGLKLLLNKHIDQFEQKLLHLQFKDLENSITIQNKRLVIPKMKIKSNALDVELFGWHDFNNQVEYHFSFRFRELKSEVTENEYGIVEDDGLGFVVYLKMYGDLDDPTIELDNTERKLNFKEYIADEKEDIKSMLKSDLGFFKKDSTVKMIEENNRNEVEFIIYDSEQEEMKDTVIEEKAKNKNHTNKLFDKWKKEADQKKKDKIEYEED